MGNKTPISHIGHEVFNDANWEAYQNIDMCGQGDIEIIHNWKKTHTIEDLKNIVIQKGYSAFTISAGNPSFGHAALKKFSFKLTKDRCNSVTTCCNHPCHIYIYKHNGGLSGIQLMWFYEKHFKGKLPLNIMRSVYEDFYKNNETTMNETRGGLDGHYFSFRTGGNPNEVVDRFEARTSEMGARVTYYRNGPVGSKSAINSATANPMESYQIRGDTLHGPVRGTIQSNGDITYSHGYTSRKEKEDSSCFADGPSLVLVPRDSPRRCIFEHANDWTQSPKKSLPMTLANSDFGVCVQTAHHDSSGEWQYKKLVLGPKDKAMEIHFRDKILFRTSDLDVMDVSHWELKAENDLNMLHGPNVNQTQRLHDMRGRSFVINQDMTISPASTPHLCLGVGLPRLVLVDINSANAITFLNKPEGSFKLELAGAFQGFGITNMYEVRRRHGEWKYVEIVIGPADIALHAHFDEKFLRREGDGLALDVSFWRYESGNTVNWVGGDRENRTRLHGGGRDFIPDPISAHGLPYMMQCGGSPNFVLGSSCDPNIYSQISTNVEFPGM